MAAEKFTQQIEETINQGFVTLGLALGTRLGMFKALAGLCQSKEAAVTSQQLADSLSFKERYVREWINGMVCGKVVDHVEIDGTDKYWLEPYRLPALLGDTFVWPAMYSELLLVGAAAIPNVEKCYPISGPDGVKNDGLRDLHKFLERRNIKWQEPENCKLIIDNEELQAKLEDGIKVLELGCGAGDPTKALATCYPKSTFIATDILQRNADEVMAKCKDLNNVSGLVLDACNIAEDLPAPFDLIMAFFVYHDVPQPQKLVDGAHNLLRSGGHFLLHEMEVHESVGDNKLKETGCRWYTVSSLCCVPQCLNNPNAEALGLCAGKELYERRLKQDFTKVERIAKNYGLFYLCTK